MVDRITVLYAGRVVENGPVRQVIDTPAHPYTRGLIDSIPNPAHRLARLNQIPGTVPDVRNLPPGCAFRARCPRAQAICATQEPALAPQRGTQSAACHFPIVAGAAA
jgi:peptide/nickel transport system ATP-binding protein